MTITPSNPHDAPFYDENLHACEQTIEYIAEFWFIDRIEYRRYHALDAVCRDRAVELRRRSKSDRVQSVRINNQLTRHGRAVYRERYGKLTTTELEAQLGFPIDHWSAL